jgi:HlyD family secretion protein
MKAHRALLPAILASCLIGCGNDNNGGGGSGMLEATEALVSFEASGRIIELRIAEGSRVGAGDTLAVIDPSRLELERKSAVAGRRVTEEQLVATQVQLRQAREAEQYAGRERDRIAGLVKSGTATQQTLDRLELEYTQAQLALQAAQANDAMIEAQLDKISADIDRIDRTLSDCYPTSPLRGVVTTKLVDQGELASPGKPLVKISQLDSLWVKVYLPAADFAQVRIGDSATVDTESGGNTYRGVVIWTAEKAEFTPKNVQTEKSRANLVYAVKVLIANTDGKLKIGMPVYVTIDMS